MYSLQNNEFDIQALLLSQLELFFKSAITKPHNTPAAQSVASAALAKQHIDCLDSQQQTFSTDSISTKFSLFIFHFFLSCTYMYFRYLHV